jgi:hypothetical protein
LNTQENKDAKQLTQELKDISTRTPALQSFDKKIEAYAQPKTSALILFDQAVIIARVENYLKSLNKTIPDVSTFLEMFHIIFANFFLNTLKHMWKWASGWDATVREKVGPLFQDKSIDLRFRRPYNPNRYGPIKGGR